MVVLFNDFGMTALLNEVRAFVRMINGIGFNDDSLFAVVGFDFVLGSGDLFRHVVVSKDLLFELGAMMVPGMINRIDKTTSEKCGQFERIDRITFLIAPIDHTVFNRIGDGNLFIMRSKPLVEPVGEFAFLSRRDSFGERLMTEGALISH